MTAINADQLDGLRALDDKVRFWLVAGPDENLAAVLAARLVDLAGVDAERVDISPDALRGDRGRLAGEAASPSLFSARRVIRLTVTGTGEDCAAAVTALLDMPTCLAPVVCWAPTMAKTAKLMKLATAHPLARAALCYAPDAGKLAAMAVRYGDELGLKLGGAVAARLVELTGGDRALAQRELDKLALYRDAAPDRQRQVTPDDLTALVAASEEEDVGVCIDAALGGDAAALGCALDTLAMLRVSEIAVLRFLLRRLLLLVPLAAEVGRGRSAGDVAEAAQPPIFFRERPAVKAQLARWRSAALFRALERTHECERALKAPGTPGRVLMDQLMLDLCRHAARA